MRKQIVAANWKMNLPPWEVRGFFAEFSLSAKAVDEVVFFPMAVAAAEVAEALTGSAWKWGAQNFYFAENGAFTGEISGHYFAQMGASYLLIGHSERRALFGEDNDLIAKKVAAAQRWGVCPMLCVGETIAERQAGRTHQVIREQLRAGLNQASLEGALVLAYEPVWAIGTGQVATPEQANEAHQVLRAGLVEMGGKALGERVPILYGGSVKPDNARELGACSDIDGFLVGGASLKATSFAEICKGMGRR